MKSTLISLVIVILALFVPLSNTSGCSGTFDVGAVKQQVQALAAERENLEQLIAEAKQHQQELEALAAALPDGPAKEAAIADNAKTAKVISQTEEKLALILDTIDRLNTELADAQNAWEATDAGVKAGAPLIPAPWGQLVLLGWGLISSFRAAANRSAARQIATSVEGKLDLTDPGVKADVRSQQGAAARRIVDEAQGKTFKLPL